jgi:hypothetical protein
MPKSGIPEAVRNFIFEYIDSIDLLEVMLLLRIQRDRSWSAKQVSDELRTNPDSAATRLVDLKNFGILQDQGGSPPTYVYSPMTNDLENVVKDLAELYKIHRHQVYELIFSSLKKSRKFLDTFTVLDKKRENDE